MLPSLRSLVHPSLLPTGEIARQQHAPHHLTTPGVPPFATSAGSVKKTPFYWESRPCLGETAGRQHVLPQISRVLVTSAEPVKKKPLYPESRQCSVPDCTKRARAFGKCCSHGGKTLCSYPGCNKCARGGGRCVKHGGGTRCFVHSCNRAAQCGGACYAYQAFRRSSRK